MSKLWHGRRIGFVGHYSRDLAGEVAGGSSSCNVIDNSSDNVVDDSGNQIVAFCFSDSCNHTVDGNTVGLWQLNGDLVDSGPNGFDLTEVGTVTYDSVTSTCTSRTEAARLETANHGTHAYDSALAIQGELTIMAMVRMDASTNGVQTIISFMGGDPDSNSANNIQYRFALDSNRRLQFLNEYGSGLNSSVTASTALDRETWYHVAVTRSASGGVVLYVNGSSDGTGTVTPPTGGTSAILRLGTAVSSNTDIDGVAGSIIVKDIEMSASEVLAASSIQSSWS